MIGLDGVTAMEDSVEEVTVRVEFPETVPTVAVMVVVPAARAVARPLLPTVATVELEELQETWVVISPLGPTSNVPVAVNCWVAPTDMVAVAGLTAMEVGTAIPFPPPQVFKSSARDPRINPAKGSLIFFMVVYSRYLFGGSGIALLPQIPKERNLTAVIQAHKQLIPIGGIGRGKGITPFVFSIHHS